MRDKKSNACKTNRGRLCLIKERNRGSKRKTKTHSSTRLFSKTSKTLRNSAKNRSTCKLSHG